MMSQVDRRPIALRVQNWSKNDFPRSVIFCTFDDQATATMVSALERLRAK